MENSGQQFNNTTNVPAGPVKIESLLEECIRRNASDLHIQYGLPPILRIDGVLTPVVGTTPLNEQTVHDLVFATLDEDQQQILMKDKEFDYSFAFGDVARFRVNAFHEKGKLAAAFRLIPNQIKNISDLGMPAIVETFADFPRGLVTIMLSALTPFCLTVSTSNLPNASLPTFPINAVFAPSLAAATATLAVRMN